MKNILKTHISAFTLRNDASNGGVYADENTYPAQSASQAGLFLKFEREDGRFHIYSVGKRKWLSYTIASSYLSGKGKIFLVDKKEDAGIFVIETNNTVGTVQIRPILENGNVAGQYLNWHGGAGANQNKTIGYWTDSGNKDAGSRWVFAPVVADFETVGEYTFSSQRMGKTPTISATIRSLAQIDDLLKGDYIHATYLGEKYLLVNSPSTTKKNEDARFEYKLEFVAGRFVLENVYLYDTELKTTDIKFSGTIHQYADFVNKSLEYNAMPYRAVVDDGINSESKFFSLQDVTIASSIQESYKQYEIPYYYVGEEIHFGYSTNAIAHKFKYGIDNGLLTIQKNPVGNKIINRCTGVGSEDNIPYYYPNKHPLGIVDAYLNGSRNDSLIVNSGNFSKVTNDTVLKYVRIEHDEYSGFNLSQYSNASYMQLGRTDNGQLHDNIKFTYGFNDLFVYRNRPWYYFPLALIPDSAAYLPHLAKYEYIGSELEKSYCYYKDFNPLTETLDFSANCMGRAIMLKIDSSLKDITLFPELKLTQHTQNASTDEVTEKEVIRGVKYNFFYVKDDGDGNLSVANGNEGIIVSAMADRYVLCVIEMTMTPRNTIFAKLDLKFTMSPPLYTYRWENEDGKLINLEDYGLKYNEPAVGDVITFKTREGSLMPFQKHLMPPIYRSSFGMLSYYNAENNKYISPESGEFYDFSFLYSDDDRREHKETFDFIKPSIENARFINENNVSLPINMFVDFAYDLNDNDDIDNIEEEYRHSYFYGRLRPLGFNLFDCANEKGEMTISMTSGLCGACNFVIGVDEESKKNTIQVDENGALIYDGNRVKTGAPQDKQNDTTNNYVWVALKKDNSTYNDIRPNATYNYKPSACSSIDSEDGDTFVIVNISLPDSFIYEAEQRLEEEIIAYMKENNEERFTFSIKFSRIFLAENPDIEQQLNDSATIVVNYNGFNAPLYVTGYTYKVVRDEALPEITVELDDELKFEESYIQKALSSVEQSVISRVENMDFVKQALSVFLQKATEDYATAKTHFVRGIALGAGDIAEVTEEGHSSFVSQVIRDFISTPLFVDGFAGCGFKIWMDEKGKSNLTVDNFTVREAFKVFEMIVAQLRAVNGGLFVSAANGKIQSVTEDDEYYYIQLENENTFMIGDYMRCQVISGINVVSYWVEICGINGNICIVAKSEFDEAVPYAGQEVVLDGSKIDGRQNAIHISATDDGSPRIDILAGISTKTHDGCIRARLGDLSKIYDDSFGENQPQGHGLYSDNAYLKGEFIVKSRGKSVDALFEVTEKGIKSVVEQTQAEAIKGKTLLNNASFTNGLDKWITSNTTSTLFSGGQIIMSAESALTKSVAVSSVAMYDNVFFVTINNGWIKQLNANFVNKPPFVAGEKYPLFFSVNIRCRTSGTLTVVIGEQQISRECAVTNDFISIDIDDIQWSGTEDFKLSFTGDADFYGVTIYTEKTEVRHRTLFEQTEKLIRIAAENFDSNGNILESSNIVTTAKMNAAFSEKFNEDGSLKSTAGLVTTTDLSEMDLINSDTLTQTLQDYVAVESFAGLFASAVEEDTNLVKKAEITAFVKKDEDGYLESSVKIKGDNIELEGAVTANGNVSIDTDGKLHAKDGEFEGKVTATEGKIAEFEISENGLTYEAGAYTASFTKEAFVLGGEIEYSGLVGRTKTFTVRGEDSINDVFPLITAERNLPTGEQNFANVPIFRIQDNSSFPTVALETTGAIHCNGSFIQRGALLKLTDAQSPNLITILENTLWVISNNYQSNAFVFLPRLTRVREHLNINNDEFFAIPIEVLSTHNSQYDSLIAVESESGESAYQYKIIDWNGGSNDYQRLSKGDSMRFLLIYDGETYYAQILRSTN